MTADAAKALRISCEAFSDNEYIPSIYTCDGRNIHPALEIGEIPEDAVSLAIIVDDPDAPRGTFTHWVVWNITPRTSIGEGALTGGVEGLNDFEKRSYVGPCPPSGTHRYFFKVFALNSMLSLAYNSGRKEMEAAMEGKVIAYGELIGLYTKENR